MTIGVVGTPVNQNDNTSLTAQAGSNRLVVDLCWNRRTGATSLSTVLWNGNTRSPTTTGDDTAGNSRSGTGIAIFKEAEIGGASNMDMTWVTNSPSSHGQMAVTVQDADQTTTVRSSASANPVITGDSVNCVVALTATAGDLLLAVLVNRNGATFTLNNGWTQLASATNGDGGRYIYAYKIATGSSDNFSVTQNVADAWQASAVALIQVSAGGAAITVDYGGLCLEGQTVNLLASDLAVMPVTHGQLALEGQELPFILTQPGDDTDLVLEGQQIALLAQALIDVASGDLCLEGQQVGLLASVAIMVDAGQMALDGRLVDLVATGIAANGDGGLLINRRRRRC